MLALWEYFWTWSGVAPPVITPSPVTPGRGSGKNHRHNDEYRTAPDEYWKMYRAKLASPPAPTAETIEERTARFQEELQQIALEQQQLAQYAGMQQELQMQVKAAPSIDVLKTLVEQSKQLKAEIDKLETTNKARIIRASSLRFSLYS